MEGISSLKIQSTSLQDGSRTSQRLRQGAGSPEGKPSAAQAAQEQTVEVEQVAALAEELNQAFRQIDGNFSVSVDEATGMVVVRITDAETGEIVKQVPPQQLLDASVSVEKIIGLLVNDQA